MYQAVLQETSIGQLRYARLRNCQKAMLKLIRYRSLKKTFEEAPSGYLVQAVAKCMKELFQCIHLVHSNCMNRI